MTRQDTIIKWIAYGAGLLLVAVLNYYVLGPLPMALPVLLPMAAVAVGTLEGATFGALFGILAGAVMTGLGHAGLGCVAALSAVGWLSGLITQYVLRRDLWGHLICCVATIVCWELWQVGSRFVSGVAGLDILVGVALPELLWSLLFSIPVYWIGRFCCVHYGRIYHE